MPAERKKWLDALRALAMLLVVLGHVCPRARGFFAFTTPVKIPLFFAISGYLFRENEDRPFGRFALDKARRLLVPYLGLSLICLPLAAALQILQTRIPLRAALRFQLRTLAAGDGLWFIPCLFELELAEYALRRTRPPLRCALLCACVGCGALMLRPGRPLPYRPEVILLMLPIAELGGAMRRLGERRFGPRAICAAALAYAAMIALSMRLRVDWIDVALDRWGCLPLNLAASALGVAALIALSARLPAPRPVVWLGQNTLTVYAFHYLFAAPMRLAMVRAGLPDPEVQLLWALPIGLAACALCTLPARLIDRFCPALVGCARRPRKKVLPG